MRPGLEVKKTVIDKISSHWEKAQSLVIVQYQGLTVTELNVVRHEIAEFDAKLRIFKNRLFNLALTEDKYVGLKQHLKGPNGFIFVDSDHVYKVAKKIVKLHKIYKKLRIKTAIIDEVVIDTKKLIQLALLPSKEELLAMLACGLQHPVRMFAIAVKEIANAKEATA